MSLRDEQNKQTNKQTKKKDKDFKENSQLLGQLIVAK